MLRAPRVKHAASGPERCAPRGRAPRPAAGVPPPPPRAPLPPPHRRHPLRRPRHLRRREARPPCPCSSPSPSPRRLPWQTEGTRSAGAPRQRRRRLPRFHRYDGRQRGCAPPARYSVALRPGFLGRARPAHAAGGDWHHGDHQRLHDGAELPRARRAARAVQPDARRVSALFASERPRPRFRLPQGSVGKHRGMAPRVQDCAKASGRWGQALAGLYLQARRGARRSRFAAQRAARGTRAQMRRCAAPCVCRLTWHARADERGSGRRLFSLRLPVPPGTRCGLSRARGPASHSPRPTLRSAPTLTRGPFRDRRRPHGAAAGGPGHRQGRRRSPLRRGCRVRLRRSTRLAVRPPFDRFPDRSSLRNPHPTHHSTVAASAVANVGGFLAIWALYTGAVHASYPVMCLAFACAYACGAGYSLGALCVPQINCVSASHVCLTLDDAPAAPSCLANTRWPISRRFGGWWRAS